MWSIPFPPSRGPADALMVAVVGNRRCVLQLSAPDRTAPLPEGAIVHSTSPDHRRVLWGEATGETARWWFDDIKPPVQKIFVARNGEEPLVLAEGVHASVAWSPDSQSIWVVSARRDRDVRKVQRIPVDGSSLVSHGLATDALPSPDGRRLLLVHTPPTPSVLVTVDRPEQVWWSGVVSVVGWSPDGRSLAFNDPDACEDLWLLPVGSDGSVSAPVRLAEAVARAAWLADGTLLCTRRQPIGQTGMHTESWVRLDPRTGSEVAMKGIFAEVDPHPRYPLVIAEEFGPVVVNVDTQVRTRLSEGTRPIHWLDW